MLFWTLIGCSEFCCWCGGLAGLKNTIPDAKTLEAIRNVHYACADVKRLEILVMLSVQPLCVCIIREILGISKSKFSYHLKILQENGLIFGTAKGAWIVYELTELGVRCVRINDNLTEILQEE